MHLYFLEVRFKAWGTRVSNVFPRFISFPPGALDVSRPGSFIKRAVSFGSIKAPGHR